MKNLFRIFLIPFCIFICSKQINAQITDSISAHQFEFDSIVKKLESKWNIRIFYNPAWINDNKIDGSIFKINLEEALNVIKKTTNLSIIHLNEIYYVLVPATNNLGFDSQKEKYIIVGDESKFGSVSHAKVKGKVVDLEGKLPIQGAIIRIPDVDKTIVSDREGHFSFDIQVGEHEFKVSFPGYDEIQKTLQVMSDGEILLELNEKSINIDEILVTANVIDRNFRRTEMSVVKFGSKEIKELPTAMGESDLIKSLSLLPGVQTTGEFGTGFNVRGGSADQNLVLVEDVPVFNTSHLFGLISILNSDAINNMTLYKGGIPVTYGERASSVLNIGIGPEKEEKLKIKGGIGIINSRLSVEIPVTKKLFVMFGGRTTYSDWLLHQVPDADLMNSSASFYDLNFFASYRFSKSDNISFFAYKSSDYFKFSGNQNYEYGNLLGSIRYTHRFNNRIYSSLMFGLSNYRADVSENDTLRPSEAYNINNSLLYKNSKMNLIWEINDKHVISTGLNVFLYDISPGSISPLGSDSKVEDFAVQNEQGIEWAGFISDDFKMSENLSLEIGLRYSHFTYLGPKTVWLYEDGIPKSEETIIDSVEYKKNDKINSWAGLEPRFSLRYNFNKENSIRLSYNRINQYVNLISNTSVITPSDLWKLSDNYVKPLVCDQFAIGYFTNTKKGEYEASFEIYYKPYKNVIEYKNGAQIILNKYIEADLINAKGQNFGIETFIKKNNGKLTGWVSYTFSKSLRKTNGQFSEEKINHNQYFPATLDRPHNLVINGGYYINRRWRFAFTFNYNTGRPVSLPEMNYFVKGNLIAFYSDRGKYRLPDYHRLDISISRYENLKLKKSWKGYWTFSIMNVYGRKNAYSVFYEKEQSPYDINQSKYTLYKMYIIGRPLPTFTYNFIF